MKHRGLAAVALAILILCGSTIAASAGWLSVPILGLSGPRVEVPSAQRTATGGAIFVAKIATHHGSILGQTVTGQLQANGSLNLGYGNSGLATLAVNPSFTPTALAIDPSTGAAWIGGHDGAASEIIAASGDGEPQQHFGDHGVLALHDDAGDVLALAWRTGRLLVSAGTGAGCQGCEMAILNPSTGATIESHTLTSETLGGPGCGQAAVTSVVFVGSQRELLGARVPSNSDCSASVTTLDPQLTATPATPRASVSPAAQQVTWTSVASSTRDICVADGDAHGIRAYAFNASSPQLLTSSLSDSLVALVPLGGSACGALIARGSRGPLVVQIGEQTKAPSVAYLPAGSDAQAMFRCHHHLLVIATLGPAGNRKTTILPVPITRGPFGSQARADRAISVTAGTGCT